MNLKPDGLYVYETTIKQAAYYFGVFLILIYSLFYDIEFFK
jgi:hypothetical protein